MHSPAITLTHAGDQAQNGSAQTAAGVQLFGQQKFTPLNKVDDMLDLAGYSRDLFGKKVLEYSFGSGNIIKQIVKRYVEDALTQNIDVNNISSGLSADIYGIELDPQLYDQCISDLNEIVRSYGISTVNWSFVCTDALQWTPDIKFDFIIGNPPYISYHDIEKHY